ncbi:hypothetical protein COO03_04980 [Bacillus sp. AFS098217]|uniref:hypothetical protein n=1 Tax=Bacillus sp. AFS098217 TaxID=2033868 RepID=UPI000BEB5BA1|nr:hypothetical protein [Bacillus sp. AFS098217]PEB54596.1 hypothetical protein COO03_04980 [Bacillus sp. AFS098217]
MIFKCKKCGEENKISGINGSCKKCNNNDMKKFEIISIEGQLTGMSGASFLLEVRQNLNLALSKKRILMIDPESKFGEKVK